MIQFLREHIIFKILALILVFTLILPSAVKFTHAFNHYKHVTCLGKTTTHLHKLDLDCKFYDFKLTHNYILSTFSFIVFVPKPLYVKLASQYVFLSTYQQLHFSLRGPPSQV